MVFGSLKILIYQSDSKFEYSEKNFKKDVFFIKKKQLIFYTSPLLTKNGFFHAFFTKESSLIKLNSITEKISPRNVNLTLKQVHSNSIIINPVIENEKEVKADGIISCESNKNLCIYTADCMPIFFADKKNNRVAAVHCGRRGLEKGIIIKTIRKLVDLGTEIENLLIAVGPSISKKNYLLDKNSYTQFLIKFERVSNISLSPQKGINTFDGFGLKDFFELDIKNHAYLQLINQGIPKRNIEISNKCTYDSFNEFHSWRKSKTYLRQWNFISS